MATDDSHDQRIILLGRREKGRLGTLRRNDLLAASPFEAVGDDDAIFPFYSAWFTLVGCPSFGATRRKEIHHDEIAVGYPDRSTD